MDAPHSSSRGLNAPCLEPPSSPLPPFLSSLLSLMSDPSLSEPTPEPSTTTKPAIDPNSSTIALMTNQFSALLEAVKELNVTMGAQKTTMEGVKSTLIEHGAKFDVLIKDALKSE